MEWGTPVKLGLGGLSWPIFKFREIPIPRGPWLLSPVSVLSSCRKMAFPMSPNVNSYIQTFRNS